MLSWLDSPSPLPSTYFQYFRAHKPRVRIDGLFAPRGHSSLVFRPPSPLPKAVPGAGRFRLPITPSSLRVLPYPSRAALASSSRRIRFQQFREHGNGPSTQQGQNWQTPTFPSDGFRPHRLSGTPASGSRPPGLLRLCHRPTKARERLFSRTPRPHPFSC